MSKKVASTKLSGLFVVGGVLGMNQTPGRGMVSSEATKPVITTEDNCGATTEQLSSCDNRSRSIICLCCDRYCNNSNSFLQYWQAVSAESASSEMLVASEAMILSQLLWHHLIMLLEAGRHSTACDTSYRSDRAKLKWWCLLDRSRNNKSCL